MKAVTFGELLLRLSPCGFSRFGQTERYDVSFGGAEANVAVSLSVLGENAAFVSKLPVHDIGQAGIDRLRAYGVDTSFIVRGGDRVGVYYYERGAGMRGGKVIYDRNGSSFADVTEDEFDWEKILNGADWFHLTGITPALSESALRIAETAVKTAHKKGITVSFDPNYRKNLWDKESAARVIDSLTRYVDVLITNAGQAEDVYGLDGSLPAEEIAKRLADKYAIKWVALTQRISHSATKNEYGALLMCGGKAVRSRLREIEVVERIGGGDSFAAGLIYALGNGFTAERAVEFAVAAACLKHTIEGDYNLATAGEVLSLSEGEGNGAVQR